MANSLSIKTLRPRPNRFRVKGVLSAIVEITLEIPETIAKALGYAPEALSRRALEALLVDECSRGHLTRGKAAELLGISFQETEDLFRHRRVPYPIKTHDDDILDNAPLMRSS